MLKKFVLLVLMLLVTTCGGGSASSGGGGGTGPGGDTDFVKGINYDPAHSQSYINGQNSDNIQQMQSSIDADLQQIADLNFTVVKTYYSEYCTGTSCLNIVNEIAKYPKLKLALGVYEYFGGANDRIFTQAQVNAAIAGFNAYPSKVVAIIVGNEDITAVDHSGNSGATDIMTDINTIKAGITGKIPPIGTAQTQNTWMNPSALPSGFLTSLTFVGANIYPFFGGATSGVVAANSIGTSVAQITATLHNAGYTGSVTVTEEGFASNGTSEVITINPSLQNEIAYYNTWKTRQDNFASYYFSMYDLIPGSEFSVTSPNNYFGLCLANGKTKSFNMLNCGA